MRYVWITFLSLALVLLGLIGWRHTRPTPAPIATHQQTELPVHSTALVRPRPSAQADSIITFALKQLGSPYTYAGSTPRSGFDCSGFVMYVYGHFDIAMPHSTAQLISVGHEVQRQQARKGDIVVFTGTAATSTTPGHAGIVISGPGEPIRFVHASSARRESGVKISEVAGTDYERRFMSVRRVLDGASSAMAAKSTHAANELEAVVVGPLSDTLAAAPQTLKKVSLHRAGHTASHQKTSAKKPLTKHTTAPAQRHTSATKLHRKVSASKK